MKLPWMKREIRLPMRTPLAFCMLLVAALPLFLQARYLTGYFRQAQINQSMAEAQNRCLILANEMAAADYLSVAQDAGKMTELRAELDTVADIFGGRMVVINQDYRVVQDSYNLSVGKSIVVEEVLKAFSGQVQSHLDAGGDFYYIAYPVENKEKADNGAEAAAMSMSGSQERADGILLLTVSTEKTSLIQQEVGARAGLFELLLIFGTGALDLVLVSLFLRPIHRLQNQLHLIADGNLEKKLQENSYRETEDISDTVSRTIDKLRQVDQSRQEFVSNVSHELKTPITSIRVLADSLMSMDNPPVELYREFMEDISGEIDREANIIDDLLTLVKMDRSQPDMNIQNVSVNEMIQGTMKRLRPIAKSKNIELSFESIREIRADVDETKLSLAIMNLVENGIKYNREEGWVHVTLDGDHRYFYIKVADNGLGIPEEQQSKVFERFYRVDKARSREKGGSGLGLAITRNIILLHHGAIRLSSEEGKGTAFTVRIPLRYIP